MKAKQGSDGGMAEFLSQVGQAKEKLLSQADERGRRRAARLADGKAIAPTDEEKKEQARLRKEEKERKSNLTKLLVGLAELGDREALEKAIRAGADPKAALAKRMTPVMAASRSGHEDVAIWLADLCLLEHRDDKHWNAAACALLNDHDRLLEKIAAKAPALLKKTRAYRWAHSSADRERGLLSYSFDIESAPRCAKYLWENRKALGLEKDEKFCAHSSALAGALRGKDRELALWHLEKAQPELLAEMAAAPKADGRAETLDLLRSVFKRDDAESLIFLLENAPALMSKCASFKASRLRWLRCGHASRRERSALPGARAMAKRSENGELLVPLAFLACEENAPDCLETLMSIPAFSGPVKDSQADEAKWLWEEGFYVCKTPELFEIMDKAGFDFRKALPDGQNLLHALAKDYHATQRMMERLGKTHSELASGRDETGKTPFEAAMEEAGGYRAPKIKKLETVFEKAAFKAGAAKASRKKSVREAAKARARL